MRRSMVIGAAILAVLAVVAVGVAAFNAGVDQGVSQELARGGNTEVVRVVGHGWGYGRGFGFPFGLILFPLFLVGIVLLIRGAFWQGRWGGGPRWWGPGGYGPGGYTGYGPSWGGPQAFDEYHRRLHEQPPADGPAAPEGGGTRPAPDDPGVV
jgi:hypothetical protein